jgi:hypothetical protein
MLQQNSRDYSTCRLGRASCSGYVHANVALIVPLTFLALLLDGLGLLAGLVALLEVQSARSRVGVRVAFRPLTLYVSARR